MTICEITEKDWDGKETTLHIDYWPDNKIKVVKSHGMGYLMTRNYLKENGFVMALDQPCYKTKEVV